MSLPPVGTLVPVTGRRLWAHQAGAGAPAVVVLPGGGALGLDYLNLQDAIARRTTCLLYDRAGTGWSDPADLPRSATEVTTELRALLGVLGIAPPYLLVGHSLGGAYAWRYAQRFPTEVAAMVLLDPLHEESPKHFPEETRQGGAQLEAMLHLDLPAPMLEMYRTIFERNFRTWPDGVRQALVARHLEGWKTGIREAMSLDLVVGELAAGGPVPDVPVTVITAMGLDPAQRAFAPDELQQRVNAGKRIVNDLVAASFSRGRNVVLEDAAHAWMTMERPDVVIDAIAELLG